MNTTDHTLSISTTKSLILKKDRFVFIQTYHTGVFCVIKDRIEPIVFVYGKILVVIMILKIR